MSSIFHVLKNVSTAGYVGDPFRGCQMIRKFEVLIQLEAPIAEQEETN
jgi:hypothetical protein